MDPTAPHPLTHIILLLDALTPQHLVQIRQHIDTLLTPEKLQSANDRLSALLRLPNNIRQRIIDFAVPSHEEIGPGGAPRSPALLQTSHRLRAEASPAYFGRNTFKRKRSRREDDLERWAKVRVGENRRHVHKIKLGPPVHCSNEDAQQEARKLDARCGLKDGTVWVLSDADFENDYQWWVNAHGEAEMIDSGADAKFTQSTPLEPSTKALVPSWYCSSWVSGGPMSNNKTVDYFSLRKGILTPQPSYSDLNLPSPDNRDLCPIQEQDSR